MLELFGKIKNKVTIAGYSMVKSLSKAKAAAKNFGFPCWLKLDSPAILHKTEQKAVIKSENEAELEKNFKQIEELKSKFGGKIIMQKSYDGIELILAVKEDKIFGKIIMLGLGGVFAEVMKNVSFRAVPVQDSDIKQMMEETKINLLLTARKKYPVEKLIKTIKDFSALDNLEINPLVVTEQETVAIDIRKI